MQLTTKELRTALDAGKTLAEIGVTEEEAAKLLEEAKDPEGKDEKDGDLAAAEALVAEAQVQIADLTGKLEEAQAEIGALKEAAVKQPDVNEKLKDIVCGIVDNRRVALGLQKVDLSAFSIDTILVEYAAATEAYEKAFKEGGMFNQKKEPAVQTAKDSIQAGHLKAASF